MGSGTVTGSLGTTDSVDTDVNHIYFYADASAQGQDHFTVTSSGTWTRYLNDTGDGIDWVTDASPSWGSSGQSCTVTVSTNTGGERICQIEFTVNMAYKYCIITQYSS